MPLGGSAPKDPKSNNGRNEDAKMDEWSHQAGPNKD